MDINIFRQKPLNQGDEIWIMNKGGEVFNGVYKGDFLENKFTFKFHNYSNGKLETIFIGDLQMLEIK